jgi:hypothetical protein
MRLSIARLVSLAATPFWSSSMLIGFNADTFWSKSTKLLANLILAAQRQLGKVLILLFKFL